MTLTPRPTRTLLKQLETRVQALRSEETDPFTVKLGTAAVACVRESREVAEAELVRVVGSVPARPRCAALLPGPGDKQCSRVGYPGKDGAPRCHQHRSLARPVLRGAA